MTTIAYHNEKKYKRLGILGKGGQAMVYKAQSITVPGKVVVMKKIKLSQTTPTKIQNILRGEVLLEKLSNNTECHPSIACLLEIYWTSKYLVIITEYLDKAVDLREARRLHLLTKSEIFIVFKKLYSALGYIHSKGIAHRDIKLGNVIVRYPEVKIIDFGLACEKENCPLSAGGTRLYYPPEQYLDNGFTLEFYQARDVFALGIMAYMLWDTPDLKKANALAKNNEFAWPDLDMSKINNRVLREVIKLSTLPYAQRPSAKYIYHIFDDPNILKWTHSENELSAEYLTELSIVNQKLLLNEYDPLEFNLILYEIYQKKLKDQIASISDLGFLFREYVNYELTLNKFKNKTLVNPSPRQIEYINYYKCIQKQN